MNQIKRFGINPSGRDFAVGDLHGHFTKLQAALDAVSFEPKVDRLFSVGDLVDRGPESDQVDTWLAKPWFHAVRGNHEQMAIVAYRCDPDGRAAGCHLHNGGAWLYARSSVEQGCYVSLLADLPLIIEVETPEGLVGIVHADCPYLSWQEFAWAVENGGPAESAHVADMAQWSRKRVTEQLMTPVEGVRAVVVGHTPVRQPAILGNVYHIDTGAWMGGHFTLINLQTLVCTPPVNPKMHWDWEDQQP
ncbi:metallophosphoesterase [Pseudomonas cichorii]|uniref:Serine/threonine protein phosphatase n=1 Tax=Pseudomonas cichorii TaxID=36746 RepID=A0ABQ1DIJ4_PSECI|nr:metallophosphoesterase [Pseudomonas cichorii]AHF68722.1 phosphoprotein phosphatase [Pseudomonas cichorii JBC1]QVE15720.1 metallophosphoesterase [Pseudomonas cichorii]GFM90828.1 serine/threonine protein phosphatase [Pseudomonas cichorii]SDN32322.1 serine/threonine protein phosphatase 1 [Pseudomonas cichorii]